MRERSFWCAWWREKPFLICVICVIAWNRKKYVRDCVKVEKCDQFVWLRESGEIRAWWRENGEKFAWLRDWTPPLGGLFHAVEQISFLFSRNKKGLFTPSRPPKRPFTHDARVSVLRNHAIIFIFTQSRNKKGSFTKWRKLISGLLKRARKYSSDATTSFHTPGYQSTPHNIV